VPKEVDLTRVPRPSREELLSRATGTATPRGTVPPGRKPAAYPLPVGKLSRKPSLTDLERQTVEAVGWPADQPLPDGAAAVIQEAVTDALASADEAHLPLPVDPSTPKIKVAPPVALSQLPPERRKKILADLAEMALTEKQQKESAEKEARRSLLAQAGRVPGLGEAMTAARQVAGEGPTLEVEDDSGLPPQPPPPARPRQPEADDADAERAFREDEPARGPSETGADPRPAFCPHCDHDLSVESVPEPEYGEKMTFLHSVLGQRCYTRDYPLFGGQVTATLRTITVRELDACFKQAFFDVHKRPEATQLDFYEAVNRYRFMLQLQRLRGPDFDHDLPDGLSPEDNPGAVATYAVPEGWAPEEGGTALPLVEKHVVENVLKTETLFRVCNTACRQFNRAVAKMEALVDKSDFWKPTGAPS
jgi:hypothetical protein